MEFEKEQRFLTEIFTCKIAGSWQSSRISIFGTAFYVLLYFNNIPSFYILFHRTNKCDFNATSGFLSYTRNGMKIRHLTHHYISIYILY